MPQYNRKGRNAERKQNNEKLKGLEEHGLIDTAVLDGLCFDIPARLKLEEGERIS